MAWPLLTCTYSLRLNESRLKLFVVTVIHPETHSHCFVYKVTEKSAVQLIIIVSTFLSKETVSLSFVTGVRKLKG